MVLIPLTLEAGVQEWVLFEFQGEIDCQGRTPDDEHFKVGTICASPTKRDTVEMAIGYHQLEGQLLALKKPFAMIERFCARVDVMDEEDGSTEAEVSYKVIGVIRRKCLFKARPRALISKPAKR